MSSQYVQELRAQIDALERKLKLKEDILSRRIGGKLTDAETAELLKAVDASGVGLQ